MTRLAPRCSLAVLAGLLAAHAAAGAEGDIVFENRRVRAVLGADGRWRSLVDTASRTDCCAVSPPCAAAAVTVGGKTRQANRAAMAGGKLVVGFAGCDTTLTYAVEAKDDWIAFRLAAIGGARPVRVTLLKLAVTITEHVGPRLNGAWDETRAVCLRATNLQTHGRARKRGRVAELVATSQDAPGPRLEGASVALVAAATGELDAVLHKLSLASDLPRNARDETPSKRLPVARQSYWFLGFAERDVKKVIDCCKRTGFRQVMLSSNSWCRTVGHYTFHTSRYPDGVESLRRTVARLHEAGILVGMHCFASKVSKTDAYVTPVPDRRFWVDRTAELAADVTAEKTKIRTRGDLSQWPGSPVARQKTWEGGVGKHREVLLGDEIVRYAAIGPAGGWDTFLGCQRGSWGTRPAPHRAGDACRHYGVDGCINGYIVDQETTLLDETTSRLAGIFNACGFDMVYFDGGEDVDRRRFGHYVSKFQAVAMGKFRKRPVVHMGTIMTHRLWHSFTRSGTVDTYLNTLYGRILSGAAVEQWPTVRDHVDRSVRYMLSVAEDRIPGELGWFGIWPKGRNTDGLQLDEIEYLMARSLAHDAPISLQTSFSQMARHPLTEGILEIVRAYETLRLLGTVDAATRRRLREPKKDFLLVRSSGGAAARFVAASPVEKVAGGSDVRALVGELPDGAGSVAGVWHYLGKAGTLRLGRRVAGARVVDVFGKPLPGGRVLAGGTDVPVAGRRATVLLPGLDAGAARKLLAAARFEGRKPHTLWIQAEAARRLVGKMARGADVGVSDPDALGDVVVCTARPSMKPPTDYYAEYRVTIPHAGRWTLWARVRYPGGGDQSFGLVRPGEPVTLTGGQVLGNCGVNAGRWHWTGRGGGVTTRPPGERIVWTLPAGEVTFRVYGREGPGRARANPRLDCLCLTDGADYTPTDADARRALARPPGR